MAWSVYGDNYSTSAMTDTSIFQPVTFGEDTILLAVRTWIILYNNPPFTSLNMKIYSNETIGGSETPKKLLATSTNSLTKSEIITLENGIKEIYFEFNYPVFNGADIYSFVLNGVGYTGSDSSHISWMKAFPDPVYSSGYTPAIETLPYAPYQLYFIGSNL